MKKMLALLSLPLVFACSKDKLSNSPGNPTLKNELDGSCEYIVLPAPVPLSQYLDPMTYTDPQEAQIDQYLYLISKAAAKYEACEGSFTLLFQNQAFARYADPEHGIPDNPIDSYEDEVEVDDLVANSPGFQSYLEIEFTNAGLNWNSARQDFVWQGHTYSPVIYLENYYNVNWNLDSYFGVGTDVAFPDSIADFIPMLRAEECEGVIDEYIIGKVDRFKAQSFDPPIQYTSQCFQNPLFIAQLGWEKSKKSADIDLDDTRAIGIEKDTLIPGEPAPGPACDLGNYYRFIHGGLGGQRFERSKRSEYRIEHKEIPVGSGNITNGWNYGYSQTGDLRDIHKNDKWKKYNFWYNIFPIRTYGISTTTAHAMGSGNRLYAATYEHDWYCKNRNLSAGKYRNVKAELRLRRKGDHEHYQLMYIPETNWCDYTVKKYTFVYGRGEILSTLY